jgi:hypothetical protein
MMASALFLPIRSTCLLGLERRPVQRRTRITAGARSFRGVRTHEPVDSRLAGVRDRETRYANQSRRELGPAW